MTKMVKDFSSQHLHLKPGDICSIGFGFVWGPNTEKEKIGNIGNIIPSIDGCTPYLLIMDEASWYTWKLLNEDKNPPITIDNNVIERHGLTFRDMLRSDWLRWRAC